MSFGAYAGVRRQAVSTPLDRQSCHTPAVYFPFWDDMGYCKSIAFPTHTRTHRHTYTHSLSLFPDVVGVSISQPSQADYTPGLGLRALVGEKAVVMGSR